MKNNTEHVKYRRRSLIQHPWVLTTLLFVIVITAAVESMAQPVEIMTFPYPPYMNGDGTGIAEKIVAAAFQEQAYSVKFLAYPRKRAIYNFQDGRGQLFLGVRAYFPEQEIDAAEILYFRRVLVYLKEQYPTLQISSLDDLKGKTTGVALGSSQIPTFQAAGLAVDEAPTGEHNIQKLYAGRVDFMYAIDLEALGLIEEFFPGQRADFGFWEFQRGAGDLIVRKNSPAETVYQEFHTGLNAIIGNGTYLHILEESYGAGQVPASAMVE